MRNPFRSSEGGYNQLEDGLDVSQLRSSNADVHAKKSRGGIQNDPVPVRQSPYEDPQYVENLLRKDSNCCQRFTIGLCSCGKIFHVSLSLIASCVFAFYIKETIDEALNANFENMVQAIVTSLISLSCVLYSILTISVNRHKILAVLLSDFQVKLNRLDGLTTVLEDTQIEMKDTQEKLAVTEESLQKTQESLENISEAFEDTQSRLQDTEQQLKLSVQNLDTTSDKLQESLNQYKELSLQNTDLTSQYEDLNSEYRSLIETYETTVVEQQTILSTTLMSVANLHRQGSSQISDLLTRMSDITSGNKDAAVELSRSFVEVDKLQAELTILKNSLQESSQSLEETTSKHNQLLTRMENLAQTLPMLLARKRTIDSQIGNFRKDSNALYDVLQSALYSFQESKSKLSICYENAMRVRSKTDFDPSDSRRSSTITTTGSDISGLSGPRDNRLQSV